MKKSLMENRKNSMILDMESLFVSVERLYESTIYGKLLRIGGSGDCGVVAACMDEARSFGVQAAQAHAYGTAAVAADARALSDQPLRRQRKGYHPLLSPRPNQRQVWQQNGLRGSGTFMSRRQFNPFNGIAFI